MSRNIIVLTTKQFALKFTKGNPTVSMAKLDFLSPKHAVARVENGGKPYEEMLDLVMDYVHALCSSNVDSLVPVMSQDVEAQRKYVDSVLRLDAKNYKNAADYVATHSYFFLAKPKSQITLRLQLRRFEDKLAWDGHIHHLKDKLIEGFAPLVLDPTNWNHDLINKAISDVQDALLATPLAPIPEHAGERFVKDWVWEYIRAYVCFGEKGPSVADAIAILGPDVVLDRIRHLEIVRTFPNVSEGPSKEEQE
jgi:hypothetical protein